MLMIISITSYGFSGDIEIGTDIYDFEESESDKDYYEPYIVYNLYPVEDSSLFIKGKSSYRDQYNKDENDKRQRHQVYVGYQWTKGKFSFEPAIGVRLESFDTGKFEDRNELRFVPTMTYRFNRKLQWYFTGYMGYSNVDGKDINGKGEVTEEYENQRVRNLITGFRYRATNRLRLDTAVQHKKREEWSSQYYSTVYRAKINYDVYRTMQTKVTLNGMVTYIPETEISKSGYTEDDDFAYRLGLTLNQEITNNVELVAKFYYQWRPQNVSGSGDGGGGGNSKPDRRTEHEQRYSLGIRYYF